MSDRIFGAVCVLLSIFYIWVATSIDLPFLVDPVGPRAFPYIIGGMLLLGGLYPIIRPDSEPHWPNLRAWMEILFAVAVMVAYAMVLRDLGFVVSTAIASGLLSWRLGATPVKAAVAGIGIAVGIYVCFHLILGLSLARGPWGF